MKMVKENPDDALYILGVGTSAGGLDALTKFLACFDEEDLNLCVVIVQHLSPDFKSELTALLGRQCRWPVVTAQNGTILLAKNIFVTPQNKRILIANGKIELSDLPAASRYSPSIDEFLNSLAASATVHSLAAILSGSGSDGCEGIRAIKLQGGFTLAQTPEDAQYPEMPAAAIQTGVVDVVADAAGLFEKIKIYTKNHRHSTSITAYEHGAEIIFELLAKKTGVNFSQYKPNTMHRRIGKRIEALRLTHIDDYVFFIKENPDELNILFPTLLIGVTEFFRDIEAFWHLKTQLEILLSETKGSDAVRIWSVGCSTGEEAYSIAMLLHEILGDDVLKFQLQIFASDIDERALLFARKGLYKEKSVSELPAGYLEKYFDKTTGGYEVKKSIKQHILFSRHNIAKDPPFVKLDLAICRNLLIYFNNYLQRQVLETLNYSLKPNALLFLGKSETVAATANLFAKVNSDKIFRKIESSPNLKIHFLKQKTDFASLNLSMTQHNPLSLIDIAKETLFSANPNPFAIITESGEIRETHGSLRLYVDSVGMPGKNNLFKIANSELVVEIRSLILQTKKTNVQHVSRYIKFLLFDKEYFVRIRCNPLQYAHAGTQLYIIEFEEPGKHEFAHVASTLPVEQLESLRITELENENQKLRQDLEIFMRDLDSTYEQIQAVNEELQSTNEELKSANEELETSNEELHSSNEEFHSANNELRHANLQLVEKENELEKSRLESEKNEKLYRKISESIPNGTIGILNDTFHVEYIAGKGLSNYNVNLKEYEGKYFPHINPDEKERGKMVEAFQKALAGEASAIELYFHDLIFVMHVHPFTYDRETEKKVMYLTQDITASKTAERSLRKSQLQFRALADNIPVLCWMADASGSIYWYNSRWYEFTGTTEDMMKGWGWQSVHDPEVLPQVLEKWRGAIAKGIPFEMVFPLKGADGNFRQFLTRIHPIKNSEGKVLEWFGTNTDITEREKIAEQKDEFIGIASHELKTPLTSVKGYLQLTQLLVESGSPGEIITYLNRADRQINKITALVNDLLDISKIKAGKLEYHFTNFSAADLINESVEEVSELSNKHTLHITGQLNLPVYGDKLRLEQVLRNFLSNAFKYSPDGTDVTLHVASNDDGTTFSVADNGIGVPVSKQPFIFDRFFRVEESSHKFQGMGMGLYISSEIIERHKGKIGVTSNGVHGSVFYFTVPGQDKNQ